MWQHSLFKDNMRNTCGHTHAAQRLFNKHMRTKHEPRLLQRLFNKHLRITFENSHVAAYTCDKPVPTRSHISETPLRKTNVSTNTCDVFQPTHLNQQKCSNSSHQRTHRLLDNNLRSACEHVRESSRFQPKCPKHRMDTRIPQQRTENNLWKNKLLNIHERTQTHTQTRETLVNT